MYPESSEGLNKETDDSVYFFTPAFYPLDNFSAHSLRIWGMTFPTLEHAFQWKKFHPYLPEVSAAILEAPSPHEAKIISDAHLNNVSPDWYEVRVAVMEELLRAKAAQHADFREALQRTGKRRIVENSPVDSFWGIGKDGKGQNIVGQLLMKVRDTMMQ